MQEVVGLLQGGLLVLLGGTPVLAAGGHGTGDRLYLVMTTPVSDPSKKTG